MTGLAVIDAGNTTYTVGLFRNHGLVARRSFSRVDAGSAGAIAAYLDEFPPPSVAVRLAGVNSEAVTRLEALLQSRFRLAVAPRDFTAPIENLCRPQAGVGLDRLFCAAAAAAKGRLPAVVIDAGTAITVDLVDGQGRFRGGAIAPGLGISFAALHQHTGGLPLIEPSDLGDAVPALGTNTKAAIQSGVVRGLAGLVDRLVDEIAAPEPVRVVLTGGDGSRLSAYLRSDFELEPDLILWGLALGPA